MNLFVSDGIEARRNMSQITITFVSPQSCRSDGRQMSWGKQWRVSYDDVRTTGNPGRREKLLTDWPIEIFWIQLKAVENSWINLNQFVRICMISNFSRVSRLSKCLFIAEFCLQLAYNWHTIGIQLAYNKNCWCN